ncbi:GEVED domain-containing protein [Algibacter sp. TI.3.09]|uniref:GEVED domain-containing protein n=1 Tax=Algibacter sp. TI.3.09 TaxID=3121298 RepID=UPI00311ECD46
MEKIYSYLPGVFKNTLASLLCLFVFNAVDAQCSYDINNLGGNDLVDWNGHYISKVTIDGDNSVTEINNPNTNTRYTDYTSISADVTAGNTYNFSIQESNNQGQTWGDLQVRIWIDYNNTGSFTEIFDNSYTDDGNLTRTISGSFTVSPTAITSTSTLRIQSAFCSSCGNANNVGGLLSSDGCDFTNTYRGDVEDYTLNISALVILDPIAEDDDLNVLVNSGVGLDNQIDVSTNDNIGTSHGTDGDDYSIVTDPFTTANGGMVTEVTDGVFQYVPAPGYVGADSFVYTLADSNGDFDTATVNITVGFDTCTPTSSSTASSRTVFFSNVNVPGESYTLDNGSGDSGGYSDFTGTVPAVDFYKGTSYTVTLTGESVMNWPKNQVNLAVFLDLNQDGDFEDAGEIMYMSTAWEVTPYPSINISIPSVAAVGLTVMRVGIRFQSQPEACDNNTSIAAEYEDYLIEIIERDTPTAADDELNVITNSSTGTANQIDVSLNDNLGSDGGDTENYTLTSPITTAQGGVITEVSDGVFEYIPATGFIGTDSFTYQICDVTPDCDTATVNVTVNHGGCVPTSNSQGIRYISNVFLPGESTTINNGSGDDGGYGNYTNLNPADLFLGGSYSLTVSIGGGNQSAGWAAYIDYNQNGNFDDPGEKIYETNGTESYTPTFAPLNFTVPNSALTGSTIIRVGARNYHSSGEVCGTTSGNPEEFEDYELNISIDPSSAQDIVVKGNTVEIPAGSTTPLFGNFTDFGIYDLNGGAKTRVYTITNNGGQALVLGSLGVNPITFQSGSSPDFTIISQPSALTVLNTGESTTFSISFDPSTLTSGISATVLINSNDVIDGTYSFLIEGEGQELYPDTDGDGISNNIDIDDDNDGIADGVEENTCLTYTNASVVETEFLYESFGAGTLRQVINGNSPGATTSYCYENGLAGQDSDECDSEININDGEYAVHYSITDANGSVNIGSTEPDVSNWADRVWYKGEDHTPGDTNGRMAIFNAADDPGVFYETIVSGILPNVSVNYTFWAINIDNADNTFNSSELPRVNPNVTVKFLSSDYSTEFGSFETGDITRCTTGNNCVDSVWIEFGTSISISESEFVIQFINNSPGGLGNDLAIDDILITQTLCDLDHDGVPDVLDLDNDNDGIPNIIEYGAVADPDPDFDATVAGSTWVDANNNGMHDFYETATPRDSDGDGTPDYLDLDSDNDAIFDVVEYDGKGDLDVSGDGVSEGTDVETGIANDEFDSDGLLGPIDGNDDDGDGDDFGSQAYAGPLDSDGDGIPDYLDVDSNDASNDTTNGSDIDTTEIYAHLDADNDGVIDGTTDVDKDGILDAFDTDTSYYGSPRGLDNSYTLLFDGRNDYVEDTIIIDAWANATIMAWIKIEPGASNDRVVVGQKNFNIIITNTGVVKVEANGNTLEDTVILPEDIWVHVGATYNSGSNEFILYVNGHNVANGTATGSFTTGTTNFTIGRTPNTDTRYFEGEIDEVRLFNEALSETSFQRMVYQELSDTNFNQGAIVPLDIDAANTFNTSLVRYFKMDTFKGDIVDDATTLTIDVGTGARLYNIKNIYFQTAPLPYETKAAGPWNSTNTWLHGYVWDIDAETTNQDWSIVHVKHSLTTATRHATAGLIVDAGVELSIQSDVELNNSWYLNLAGLIDLEGESQLIQTEESVLEAAGSIERDQQGTENLYTYNYWSSPVHTSNPNADIDGDETYTVASILRDGEDADNPSSISFVGGYDGNNTTSPIQIADYWIWKYSNNQSDNYSLWEHVGSTNSIKVGEGYTMKGPGTGSVSTDKNYVFQGTPNNGEILLPITAGNDYLIGNPYPSAIDADIFINDNLDSSGGALNGTLYFWEHFGGGSHIYREYQGGYGTYNLSGGAPAIAGSHTASDPAVSGLGTGTKTPTKNIPVGQGFFVTATSSTDIKFNNNQRTFATETNSSTSIFLRRTAKKTTTATTDSSLEDLRTKLRLNYNSPNGYIRQLLTTIDENATIQNDRGYDAPLIEDNGEDMFWNIGESNFVIQGIDLPTETTALPLSVKTQTAGEVVISLAELKYPTEGFELYLKDNLTQTYHDLLENSSYTTSVEEGITANRFEIVFAKPTNTLGISDNEITQDIVSMYYDASDAAIHITNPDNFSIENITGTNILGQNVLNELLNSSDKNITLPANLTLGVYIFTIETDHSTITKKMIIK